MQRFKISDPSGRTVLTVTAHGRLHTAHIHAEFHPLEQPEFVDALERTFRIEQITKDEGAHGCTILVKLRPEQKATIIEDVEGILTEYYRGA